MQILVTQLHVTPKHERHHATSLRRLHCTNTLSRFIYPSLAIMPFCFGVIKTWPGGYMENEPVVYKRIRYMNDSSR